MNMPVQFPSNATMQPGARYMQHQQAQQMTPQSLMAAPSSMLYGQQSLSTLQQQSLHSQLGMSSGVNNGLHLLQGETGVVTTRGFPDFGRNSGDVLQLASRGLMGGVKQEPGNGVSLEGRGGHNADGPETLYLKVPGEGNWRVGMEELLSMDFWLALTALTSSEIFIKERYIPLPPW